MAFDFDLDAAVDYNQRHMAPPDERRIAQAIAAWQKEHGLAVDGKLGPRTRESFDAVAATPATPSSPPVDYGRVAEEALSTKRQVAVRLARDATHERIYYDLGAGGSAKRPAWPPWDENMRCDCSAFVGGVIGEPRNDGDWNTAKMVADATRFDRQARTVTGKGPERRFTLLGYVKIPTLLDTITKEAHALLAATILDLLTKLQPGDVIVKDGTYDRATGRRTAPGHTGVVVAVHLDRFDPAHPELWFECVEVVHCSGENSRTAGEPGHAIGVSDAHPWKREAMLLVFKPFAEAA